MNGKILLVPLTKRGGGTGHVRRCLAVARYLGERAVLLCPDAATARVWGATGLGGAEIRTTLVPGEGWDLVVIDRRRTRLAEQDRIAAGSPVLALDDTGEIRAAAAYVLDVIPGTAAGSAWPPNRVAPELLELPAAARTTAPERIERILVTFGGEDRARLTERVVAAIHRAGLDRTRAVTVVQGASFGRDIVAPGARVVSGLDDLSDILGRHELVITAYGLTAFEALASGTPVLVVNPTSYHERLARLAGLPTVPGGRTSGRRIGRWLERADRLWAPVASFQARRGDAAAPEGRGYRGLSAQIARLADALPEPAFLAGRCPVCSGRHTALARYPARTYYRCPQTGLIYALPFPDRPRQYTEEYFFEAYRAQYGRTYLEDFDAIREVSRERLRIIARYLAAPGPVVDIGCAYGPFLAACAEAGHVAAGMDIAQSAVEHVRSKLGMTAWTGDFASADLGELRAFGPRCLTMWYVIEHFPDLGIVLQRAADLLAPGGVLAFSTPSSAGVSARTDLGAFLERSPMDHYTIWSPACASRVLARYGFRVVYTRVTGHHPERSPLLARMGRAGAALSRALGLGDTFEVYAVRTPTLHA